MSVDTSNPWISIDPDLFQWLSQVISLTTTELEDGEEQIVAVRLVNLQDLCQKNGVKIMPEKVIRDCIEKFELGKLLM